MSPRVASIRRVLIDQLTDFGRVTIRIGNTTLLAGRDAIRIVSPSLSAAEPGHDVVEREPQRRRFVVDADAEIDAARGGVLDRLFDPLAKRVELVVWRWAVALTEFRCRHIEGVHQRHGDEQAAMPIANGVAGHG